MRLPADPQKAPGYHKETLRIPLGDPMRPQETPRRPPDILCAAVRFRFLSPMIPFGLAESLQIHASAGQRRSLGGRAGTYMTDSQTALASRLG